MSESSFASFTVSYSTIYVIGLTSSPSIMNLFINN